MRTPTILPVHLNRTPDGWIAFAGIIASPTRTEPMAALAYFGEGSTVLPGAWPADAYAGGIAWPASAVFYL